MGDHWHSSGIFLKSLRAWDYPNKYAFCPQKAMLACWHIADTFFACKKNCGHCFQGLIFRFPHEEGQLWAKLS